jgi:hypothetical protein
MGPIITGFNGHAYAIGYVGLGGLKESKMRAGWSLEFALVTS